MESVESVGQLYANYLTTARQGAPFFERNRLLAVKLLDRFFANRYNNSPHNETGLAALHGVRYASDGEEGA
jgi:hypothetical protein